MQVGNLQHLAACDDWSPACPNTVFTAPTDDPFYRFSLAIPQGYFEYKVAIGGSWAINYGDFGRRDGPNVPLGVESDSTVNFYYNSATNHLYDTVANPVTYVAGTFQTALGCTSNDDLNCLAGQLTDFAFSGTSTFVAHLPAGPHSVSLARTAVPAASVLASSVAFTVPADGASVTFSLQGTTFSVAVAGGQTVSVQITSTTPTSTGTTGPTPTGTCVHTPRSYYLTVPVQHTFSEYVGNVFFGELRVLNIGNPKTVTVNYADAVGNWGNQCGTSYGSGPYESNYEVWKFSCTIGAAGISQFNVQYDVNGNTYFDNNGGSNFLITAKQPAPFTHGFQRDISHYFQQEVPRAIKYMLQAISPANTSIGVVVAAPKKQVLNQNYFYHWIRDASLTMDVVNTLFTQNYTQFESLMWNYGAFTNKIQNINALTGLGEAKFEVNGSDYTLPWCRPQNDGPAFRSSAFMRFSTYLLKNGGDPARVIQLYTSTIKPDLDYVSQNYATSNTCDLWEEQVGLHFFTQMAQRRAMKEGIVFATLLNDTASAAAYTTAASDLDNIVQTYWNPTLNTIQAIQNSGRQLDSSIPLGVIHGYNGDGVFAPESDKVLATLYQFALGMISEYPLNQNTLLDNHDKPMGVAIGRYYGDHYDGVGTASQGNPWHLTTTSFAEVYYRAALGFLSQGSIAVTDLNFPFLSGPRPMGLSVPNLTVGATLSASSAGFKAVISALKAVGDSYVRRSRFYQQADGHLAEEFNRDCGEMNGVNDLTWSYAAFLSASFARAELFAVNGED